jgi:pimeloyl-ACP methyl ester carboxylesterase
MKPSRSVFVPVRGLRYHCRVWGTPGAPRMFLLHGWMDVSASFQFLVDAFALDWEVVAPDWRGYGETDRSGADCYWFPDYFADLDVLLAHFSRDEPVRLVGHSMGGNAAAMYAGIRPARVRQLVNLEGFGMPATRASDAPRRYERWMNELAAQPALRDYENFDALAARLRSNNARLSAPRAAFLATHWGRRRDDGRVELRGDPAHKVVNAVQYNLQEAEACWRAITAACLWVQGAETETPKHLRLSAADVEARLATFPNLQRVTIPDAGHMLHHDQPERLAAVVEEFLRDSRDRSA